MIDRASVPPSWSCSSSRSPALLAGWERVALLGTADGAVSWYFWKPLVAGVIGVLIYEMFICDVLHARAGPAERPAGRSRDAETASRR